MRSIIPDLLLEKKRVKTRTLYHIGPRPASPKPKVVSQNTYRTAEWDRHWLDQPVSAGVFMSPNPLSIAQHHGIYGNVYAYKVPEWVIKKAGGINRFDWGSEILIPEDLWNEANPQIKLIGKTMSRKDLLKKVLHRWRGPEPGKLGWLNALDTGEKVRDRKQSKMRRGLRATKHLDDVINMMTKEERQEALDAFEQAPDWDRPGRWDPLGDVDANIVATLKRRLAEARALMETMHTWRVRHDA